MKGETHHVQPASEHKYFREGFLVVFRGDSTGPRAPDGAGYHLVYVPLERVQVIDYGVRFFELSK